MRADGSFPPTLPSWRNRQMDCLSIWWGKEAGCLHAFSKQIPGAGAKGPSSKRPSPHGDRPKEVSAQARVEIVGGATSCCSATGWKYTQVASPARVPRNVKRWHLQRQLLGCGSPLLCLGTGGHLPQHCSWAILPEDGSHWVQTAPLAWVVLVTTQQGQSDCPCTPPACPASPEAS